MLRVCLLAVPQLLLVVLRYLLRGVAMLGRCKSQAESTPSGHWLRPGIPFYQVLVHRCLLHVFLVERITFFAQGACIIVLTIVHEVLSLLHPLCLFILPSDPQEYMERV